MRFKLISHGMIFKLVRRFDYFGIPCVYGVSENGKWQTTARVEDVDLVVDVQL